MKFDGILNIIIVVSIIVLIIIFLRRNMSGYSVSDPPKITLNFKLPLMFKGGTKFTKVKIYSKFCMNQDGTNSGCADLPDNPTEDEMANQVKIITNTLLDFTDNKDGTASTIVTFDKFMDPSSPDITKGVGMKIGVAMVTDKGDVGDFEYTTFNLKVPDVTTKPASTTKPVENCGGPNYKTCPSNHYCTINPVSGKPGICSTDPNDGWKPSSVKDLTVVKR